MCHSQDGLVSPTQPLNVVIEVCDSAHFSRRHDAERYSNLYSRVSTILLEHISPMQPIEVRRNETADNESFQPRVGAFEVFVEWVGRDGISVAINIFSKLESLRYPNPNNIVMRLKTLLDRGGRAREAMVCSRPRPRERCQCLLRRSYLERLLHHMRWHYRYRKGLVEKLP